MDCRLGGGLTPNGSVAASISPDGGFMSHSIRLMVAGVFAASAVLVAAVGVSAAPKPKLYICHATGSEGNPFVAIAVPEDSGLEPHLDDNGSPLSGHEQDFLSTSRNCDSKVPK
jgi:hypothetical protein